MARNAPVSGRHERCLQTLAQLAIEVAVPLEGGGEQLLRAIRRTRAKVVHRWPPPGMFSGEADILVSEFGDELPQRLPWTVGEPRAALVVVLPADGQPDLGRLEGCAPHGVLIRPMPEAAVPACLVAAHSQYRYESRLRARTAKLEETVRAMQLVERAKRVLMDHRAMSEQDAYRFLRDRAMRQRVPIRQIAQTVIDSQQIM